MWALDLESDFSWKQDRTCKIDEELEAGCWREKWTRSSGSESGGMNSGTSPLLKIFVCSACVFQRHTYGDEMNMSGVTYIRTSGSVDRLQVDGMGARQHCCKRTCWPCIISLSRAGTTSAWQATDPVSLSCCYQTRCVCKSFQSHLIPPQPSDGSVYLTKASKKVLDGDKSRYYVLQGLSLS